MDILSLITGAVALLAGRRAFWLFIGTLGFVAGFSAAEILFPTLSQAPMMAIGILAGVICGLTTIFLQRVAVGIAGLFAGAYLTLEFVRLTGFSHPQYTWVICLAGGILGTVLLAYLFDWALIALSALVGANMCTLGLAALWPPLPKIWAFLLLLVIGLSAQINAHLSEKSPTFRKGRRLR